VVSWLAEIAVAGESGQRPQTAEDRSLRQSLDLSAESMRVTLFRYQAGEATALEVVGANGD